MLQAVLKHLWAETILVSQIKFNRLNFYDCRRLHNQYLAKAHPNGTRA